MDEYLKHIDQQIKFNQGKNLFLDDNEMVLKFVDETLKAISKINNEIPGSEDTLIDYAADKAIEEFCRINQYFSFNSQAKADLRKIYRELLLHIKSNEEAIVTIEKNHFNNLKQWLLKTNPFSLSLYSKSHSSIDPVACSEYTADIQLKILQIDTHNLPQPVLDIGCGKQGNLVKYLCAKGFDAVGIDRFSFSDENLLGADWLEYDYGTEKWGTILSNLGFSNHFHHHNLRDDGNYVEYARKYMQILQSLKIGGRFHYAPDLPFVELHLNTQQYKIEKHDVGEFGFKTSVVSRIA